MEEKYSLYNLSIKKKLLTTIGLAIVLISHIFPSKSEATPIKESSATQIMYEFELTHEEREKIRHAFKGNKYELRDETYRAMKDSKRVLETILPTKLIASLKELGRSGRPDMIRIKGFPVDSIPPGQDVAEKRKYKSQISESIMLGITNIMGYKLHSNPKEQGGRLIHDIHPVKGREADVSSKGKKPFYLHTENPFEFTPPYFLMLMGLEEDAEAETSYFPLKPFLSGLPSWVIETMKSDDFEIRSGAGLDQVEKTRSALISEDPSSGEIRVRLYQDPKRIKPLSEAAAKALEYLTQAFPRTELVEGLSLEKGELIIFNNGFGQADLGGIMHGRKGYISNPNRWLQRGFLFPQDNVDKAILTART